VDFNVPVLFNNFVAFTFLASFDLLMSFFAFFTCNSFFYFEILALASSRSFSRFSKYSILFFLSTISVSLATGSVVFSTFVTFYIGTHFSVVFYLTMIFFFGTTFYTGLLINGACKIFLTTVAFFGATLVAFFFGTLLEIFFGSTGTSYSIVTFFTTGYSLTIRGSVGSPAYSAVGSTYGLLGSTGGRVIVFTTTGYTTGSAA
jgi:hypothetical protein